MQSIYWLYWIFSFYGWEFDVMHYRLTCLLLDLIYISKFPMNYMLDIFLVDGYNFANYFFCFFWILLWIVWWILDYIFLGKIQLANRSFLVSKCWILFMVNGFCWKVIHRCQWHCLDEAKVEANSNTLEEEETFKVSHPLLLFNYFVLEGFFYLCNYGIMQKRRPI
jgi:hypothetical protein